MNAKQHASSFLFLLVITTFVLSVLPASAPTVLASGGASINPSTFVAIVIDGTNDFKPVAHITENPFAAPTAGGSTTDSDFLQETSATHWIDGDWVDHQLPADNTADVKQFYVQWDASYLYLGVQGPNAMMDGDVVDLFIAIDRDGSQSGNLAQSSTAWGKWVDFDGWSPEYFIAVSQAHDWADSSPAGYAELRPVVGPSTNLIWGTDWSNSGWVKDSDGGVFYEFRVAWTLIGGQPNSTTGTPMNFAVYTTFGDFELDAYDLYDSAPGFGQGVGSPYEEVGDYKGDGDHCGTSFDPVTGTTDGTCTWGDSDDNNGAGRSQYNRNPGSDDGAIETPDTIGEYFRILNVGMLGTTSVRLASFTATPLSGAIRIDWETVTEIDNLGFHLYRAAAPTAKPVRLNAALIPSKAPGSPVGASYTWPDRAVRRGVTYYYWLEDVDIHGFTTLHGPVKAALKSETPGLVTPGR